MHQSRWTQILPGSFPSCLAWHGSMRSLNPALGGIQPIARSGWPQNCQLDCDIIDTSYCSFISIKPIITNPKIRHSITPICTVTIHHQGHNTDVSDVPSACGHTATAFLRQWRIVAIRGLGRQRGNRQGRRCFKGTRPGGWWIGRWCWPAEQP